MQGQREHLKSGEVAGDDLEILGERMNRRAIYELEILEEELTEKQFMVLRSWREDYREVDYDLGIQ